MVFSDLIFIYLFLPVCLLCYNISGNIPFRNTILVLFSFLFYSFGEPVWVVLLLVSSLTDYCCGLFIEKHREEKKAVLGLITSLVINLSLLFVFKYSGFVIGEINSIAGTNFAVPAIRISFYTFQTISYTADVYRKKAEAQHNFLDFLLFVSMFFQLVAGPVVRYTDISAQITERRVSADDISAGIYRFIAGLGKKVLIANVTGEITAATIESGEPASVLAAWTGAVMFALQIYFDFSGYSDMAIGLGMIFGFRFPENFNYPYISRSASEFWRRWHISLGTFFRDYVYIPMGGNRRHQILNIAVVWFLTGLWHGASWNFILWGLYFGVLVGIEKLFLGKVLEKLPVLSNIYLIAAVLFGWLLFYFEDMGKMAGCLSAMTGTGGVELTDSITVSMLKNNLYVIIAAVVLCCPIYRIISEKLIKAEDNSAAVCTLVTAVKILFFAAVLAVSSIMLVKQSYNPFLYFRY